ncbi:LOW QUALITY PROTEIN: hypothetical protein Cgig2_030571 [Carnegiea gigantea]|uniref:Uncharacterized protein n=1 Tax=Carnegiea gigantea TaxID=171969 RepID=A0A9Q1GPV8_9CARY|nr:LOW QUALITY PROTEIN: hypothetical protein Cgig2_030571 [Carnegiea gigantea]
MSWTRESLAARFALMKLAEGRRARCVPLMTGSPIGEGPITRLSLPPLAMGRRPRPHPAVPRSPPFFKPTHSRLLSAGHKGGCLQEKDLVYIFQEKTRRSDESGHVPYLLSLLSNKALPLLLPPAFDVSCHLFGSGVPDFEDRQPRPRLICIKQKGSQLALGRLGILGVILKNQKVGSGKEEVIG